MSCFTSVFMSFLLIYIFLLGRRLVVTRKAICNRLRDMLCGGVECHLAALIGTFFDLWVIPEIDNAFRKQRLIENAEVTLADFECRDFLELVVQAADKLL